MARAVGLLPVLVWGVLAGLWRPRGPVFGFEALIIVGVSLLVGFFAGRVSRSRWAMVLAPVLFAFAGEITRAGLTGPTVDYPRFTPLGLIALVAGRGAYTLLALLPLFVGAAYGAGSRRRGRSPWRWVGRVVTLVPALTVLATAVVVALPGRAAPVPGGISELTYAGKLGLMIRGARLDAPVLLFVPGLPGGSEIGPMRQRLQRLEQRFIVVTMDRRGGGRSFGALDPTPTFTVDDEMRGVLAVTDYLRTRFRRDKIYLVAHATGTIGAALAVQENPADFAAYVGVAQVNNQTNADRGQSYSSIYGYEPLFLNAERPGVEDSLRAPELSPLDKLHVVAGLLDSFDTLYPQLRGVDLKTQVPALAVPVYFAEGDRETTARRDDLRQWFAVLQAPHKEIVTLAGAGHRAMFDQPDAFAALLDRVRAENPVTGRQ